MAFYQQAFGVRHEVIRRTRDRDFSSIVFGSYGENDFFLLTLVGCADQTDRPPGPSTFGFLVEDLDATHAAALSAGASELSAPHEAEGMPRCSAVKDPSGNWIWLYQS